MLEQTTFEDILRFKAYYFKTVKDIAGDMSKKLTKTQAKEKWIHHCEPARRKIQSEWMNGNSPEFSQRIRNAFGYEIFDLLHNVQERIQTREGKEIVIYTDDEGTDILIKLMKAHGKRAALKGYGWRRTSDRYQIFRTSNVNDIVYDCEIIRENE